MKTHTEYITIRTDKEKEIINITNKIQDIIDNSKIKEGLVLVNSMHITSSIFINDEESGLKEDFMQWLEKLAPYGLDYKHHQTGEDNADAHIKRTLMGHQVTMAITNNALDLGPWEQIYYAEFDGQRKKRVLIKIIGE